MKSSAEKNLRWLFGLLVMGIVMAFLSPSVRADNKRELTNQAYQAYMSGDFKQALELYRQAGAEIPEAAGLEYNKGDAHFQLGDFEQALKTFEKAALTDNDELAAGAHYNSGNTYFEQQEFQKAIEQYKSALQRNPEDAEARRNLEIALRKLQEQQKQEQKQDKDGEENKEKQEDQQQDQQENQDQQDKDKKDQQDKDKKNKDKKDQESQPKPDSSQSKPEQKPQKSNPYKMSKEDAERLLNALKDEEREHQKNKRLVSTKTYNGKDW